VKSGYFKVLSTEESNHFFMYDFNNEHQTLGWTTNSFSLSGPKHLRASMIPSAWQYPIRSFSYLDAESKLFLLQIVFKENNLDKYCSENQFSCIYNSTSVNVKM